MPVDKFCPHDGAVRLQDDGGAGRGQSTCQITKTVYSQRAASYKHPVQHTNAQSRTGFMDNTFIDVLYCLGDRHYTVYDTFTTFVTP